MRDVKVKVIISVIAVVLVLSFCYVMYKIYSHPIPRLPPTKELPVVDEAQSVGTTETEPESKSDPVAQVKAEIIAGTKTDVPDFIDMTVEDITREYLNNCENISSTKKRVECASYYYEHNNAGYAERKSGCGSSPSCLDRLYFEMAHNDSSLFCDGIMDGGLREECKNKII